MNRDEIMRSMSAITESGDVLTDEQVAEYERLEGELARVNKTEEIVARQAAYNSVSAPAIVRAMPKGVDSESEGFDRYLRTGKPNGDLVRAQAEGLGSAGGFLVPPSFRDAMQARLKAFGGIAGGATEIATSTGEPLYWPTNDDTSTVGSITAEGANLPQGGADLTIGTIALNAYKYSSGGASNAPLKVSYELLQDSAFDLVGFIAKNLGTRIGRQQAADLAAGTGAGQPTGLLSAAGGLTQTASWSSNTTPTYNDLVNFVHTLDPAYRAEGCVWVFSDATLKLVRQIKDGNSRPLFWDQSMNLSNGLTGLTLLGFPVIVDQGCPAPGAVAGNSFGFFGNLSEAYVIRRVKDITMVTLDQLFAANGQVGYMAWARMDAIVQNKWAGVLLKAA